MRWIVSLSNFKMTVKYFKHSSRKARALRRETGQENLTEPHKG